MPISAAGGLPPIRNGEVATERRARESGLSQVQYLATQMDVQRLQNAMRAAERGDVYLLNTYIRDMIVSNPHLNAEWGKRKMVIIGQPLSLTPVDPKDSDDVIATKVIAEASENCDNWQTGLKDLLDGTLKPLAAAEKIFEPISLSERGKFKYLRTYRLKQISAISDLLHCYKIPYQPNGMMKSKGQNPATLFDVDNWEPWLRFYDTTPNGMVSFNTSSVYSPDPSRHIIHKGTLQSSTIPQNFGGLARLLLFINLFTLQARDHWTLMMAKYGSPIPVAVADSANVQIMSDLQQALALGMQLGGIVIPKGSELTWSGTPGTDGSGGHKMYQDWGNCEISKVVLGQVTSARPEKGGLAGGMAEQSEAVRDDIRMWDTTSLAETLRKQAFQQILSINGYRGRPPYPTWGGAKVGDAAMLGKTVQSFAQAGIRPADQGIITISQRTGVEFERTPDNLMMGTSGGFGGKSGGNPDN